MLAKSKIAWAINETTSMRRAAKILSVSYNTFKKYAKMYDLWEPASNAGISRDSKGRPIELDKILAGENPNYHEITEATTPRRLFSGGVL